MEMMWRRFCSDGMYAARPPQSAPVGSRRAPPSNQVQHAEVVASSGTCAHPPARPARSATHVPLQLLQRSGPSVEDLLEPARATTGPRLAPCQVEEPAKFFSSIRGNAEERRLEQLLRRVTLIHRPLEQNIDAGLRLTELALILKLRPVVDPLDDRLFYPAARESPSTEFLRADQVSSSDIQIALRAINQDG